MFNAVMFVLSDNSESSPHKRNPKYRKRLSLKRKAPGVQHQATDGKQGAPESTEMVAPIMVKNRDGEVPIARPLPQNMLRPVNDKLVQLVHETLTNLGIKRAWEYTARWSAYRFYTLANFAQGCDERDLPIKWGDQQISALLDHLHQKFYVASNLDGQWNAFKKVGHDIG